LTREVVEWTDNGRMILNDRFATDGDQPVVQFRDTVFELIRPVNQTTDRIFRYLIYCFFSYLRRVFQAL
jgi:hypothetical protein